jgi:hypothetical protein
MANNRKLDPRGTYPITGERKEHFDGGKKHPTVCYMRISLHLAKPSERIMFPGTSFAPGTKAVEVDLSPTSIPSPLSFLMPSCRMSIARMRASSLASMRCQRAEYTAWHTIITSPTTPNRASVLGLRHYTLSCATPHGSATATKAQRMSQ